MLYAATCEFKYAFEIKITLDKMNPREQNPFAALHKSTSYLQACTKQHFENHYISASTKKQGMDFHHSSGSQNMKYIWTYKKEQTI
jgi:hypothetical protein